MEWNWLLAALLSGPREWHNRHVPRTRFPELIALAEENDGLLTATQARKAGISDSVLARLTQRGRLLRTARGV